MGKTLQSWIKEFGTLVFTQTVQAFIYAIIISIIVFSMTETQGIEAADQNTALGFIAVISLVSIFKVEELLRKIFGLSSTKASVKGAMGSLAKTAIAAKVASKTLDNTKKMATGAKEKFTANKQDRKDREATEKQAQKIESNYQNKEKQLDFNKQDANSRVDKELEAKKREIKADQANRDSRSPDGLNSLGRAKIQSAIQESSGKKASNETKEKQMQAKKEEAFATKNEQFAALQEQAESKKEANAKMRREGVKKMASSGLESVGAIIGTPIGGIIGIADGDISEGLRGMGVGMGVGDAMGQGIANIGAARS